MSPILVKVSGEKHLAVPLPNGGGRNSMFHVASTGMHCQIWCETYGQHLLVEKEGKIPERMEAAGSCPSRVEYSLTGRRLANSSAMMITTYPESQHRRA